MRSLSSFAPDTPVALVIELAHSDTRSLSGFGRKSRDLGLWFTAMMLGTLLCGCAGDAPSEGDTNTAENGTDDPDETNELEEMEVPTDPVTTCEGLLDDGTRDFCLSPQTIATFWPPESENRGGVGGAVQDTCPAPDEIPYLVKTEAGAVGDVCGKVVQVICDDPISTDAGCCYAAIYGSSPGCDN